MTRLKLVMNKRLFLGVSGGVDSAVSAILLKSQGYEVIGVHLVVSEGSKDSDAKRVCDVVGIKYLELDVIQQFKEQIKDPFVKSYCQGETPSPCLLCNERVKFKILSTLIERENDYIATGHYAFIDTSKEYGKKLFLWDRESIKDQCYMLYRLPPHILERVIFPLAGMPKSEVRALAKSLNLPVYAKKDSQNLCFAKEGYLEFLNQVIEHKTHGDILDIEGHKIGEHRGFQEYTIGQRKGLGLNLKAPYFVLEIRPETNVIVAGPFSYLERKFFFLRDVVLHVEFEQLSHCKLIGRSRSSSKGFLGELTRVNGRYLFVYDEKNSHGAKGQHLVLYSQNLELVAGGIIDELK